MPKPEHGKVGRNSTFYEKKKKKKKNYYKRILIQAQC